MKRDYYEVLEVDKGVGEADLKKAYRKMAMKFHPDKNPGDKVAEDKFKEAAEAYSILSDSQKRAQYDQFGHAATDGGAGGFGGGFGGFADFDLSDALRTFMEGFGSSSFDDFFGGGGGHRRRRGGDMKATLQLSLEEVAEGVTKTIKVKRMDGCDSCGGTGGESGAMPSRCTVCNGSGQVRQISRSLFGQFVNVGECSNCGGTGEVISKPCRKCAGDGRAKKTAEIKVKVPAGVAAGNYMTLRGEGNAGPRGTERGDLVVFFDEIEHKFFTRHGEDIITEVEISFSQAALGDKIEVPTLKGMVNLTIPPGIQSGQVLRMRSKGLGELRGGKRGDQLVKIQVSTPTKLNSSMKKLFEQLASVNGAKRKSTVRKVNF
ncbi:MAG: molecular chaperone DnaJ [Candidatus Marinimicrobia bacterium]|mgnify:CR=1 FL=1|nr:molecular chaperone DnaJ [Candidatus Neomarinimicrobiota bacterium]